MKSYVVWMDSDNAKVFLVSEHPIKKSTLHHEEVKHHTREYDLKNPEKYFHTLAHDLQDAGEVVITGPGLAKEHFLTHLERHRHGELRHKIIGCLPLDHPSENEILAFSRKFFKKYDLFH